MISSHQVVDRCPLCEGRQIVIIGVFRETFHVRRVSSLYRLSMQELVSTGSGQGATQGLGSESITPGGRRDCHTRARVKFLRIEGNRVDLSALASVTAQSPNPTLAMSRQGHYAGVASRGAAFAADVGALWLLYTLGVILVAAFWQLITGKTFNLGRHQAIEIAVLIVWWFVYFSYQWTLGGRTVGMALLGLQVVQKDGRPITGREAMLRALLLYFSFLFAVVAALFIVYQRERRTIHDLIAGTAVVYSWDARAAKWRWLSNRGVHSAVAHQNGDVSNPLPMSKGREPSPSPTSAGDSPK